MVQKRYVVCNMIYIEVNCLKDYIADRVILLANHMIETKATVRSTAKKFGVSKSTVHTVRSICVGCVGTSQCTVKTA